MNKNFFFLLPLKWIDPIKEKWLLLLLVANDACTVCVKPLVYINKNAERCKCSFNNTLDCCYKLHLAPFIATTTNCGAHISLENKLNVSVVLFVIDGQPFVSTWSHHSRRHTHTQTLTESNVPGKRNNKSLFVIASLSRLCRMWNHRKCDAIRWERTNF